MNRITIQMYRRLKQRKANLTVNSILDRDDT